MTDDAVPEGHKGLHGFLYGDGGAEEHDSRGYSFRHVRAAAAVPAACCACSDSAYTTRVASVCVTHVPVLVVLVH